MNRQEIQPQYKWDLTALFSNENEWYELYSNLNKKISDISKYKGKLKDHEMLYECLKKDEEISKELERLQVYAVLNKDQDTRNSKAQKMLEEISNLSTKISEATSFITSDLLELKEEDLENAYKKESKLDYYKKMIWKIKREKEHILSQTEEELIAKLGDITGVGSDVFDMFNDADISFPEMEMKNGEKKALTKSTYSIFLDNKDRDIRKQAYEKFYHTYMNYKNTLATTLYSTIKENVIFSKVRRYPSALEESLHYDDVPKEVYLNLLKTTKKHLKPLRKYLSIRKKILGVDELQMWDIRIPLVKEYKEKISYEKAYEWMKEGLSVLGQDYIEVLDRAKKENWIDVFENDGKRGGAYAWGSYGTHPYVLLNHKEDIDSLFTLAHEMGHAMHSYYSDKENPYLYAQYTIFVAEVASTVNEVLLMQYLLKKARLEKNIEMEKYLLNYFLEQFRGTLFRQAMFAEFEYLTHKEVEEGNPLTAEDFNNIYINLHKEYYGDAVVHDEEISHEWMRIPHFYTPFYVYKYSTGFSAAIAIAKSILEHGQPAVDNYKKFLQSGGTDFPIELLKIANVDMSTSKPIEDALQYFEVLVSQFENIMK